MHQRIHLPCGALFSVIEDGKTLTAHVSEAHYYSCPGGCNFGVTFGRTYDELLENGDDLIFVSQHHLNGGTDPSPPPPLEIDP